MSETEDYEKSAIPTAHAESHQDGGDDEITVEGLAGELAAEQKSSWAKVSGKPVTFTPSAHAASHQDGGADEISVAGLSGQLADNQPSDWTILGSIPADFPPETHHALHETGGADEINITTFQHNDLGGIGLSDHHIRYSNAEAVAALGYSADVWTPTLTFGGLSTGITYTIRIGRYIKIKNLIFCHGRIVLTSKGSAVGTADIKNFPEIFSTENVPGNLYMNSVTYTGQSMCVGIIGQAYMRLYDLSEAGVVRFITNANFANNSDLTFSIVYIFP